MEPCLRSLDNVRQLSPAMSTWNFPRGFPGKRWTNYALKPTRDLPKKNLLQYIYSPEIWGTDDQCPNLSWLGLFGDDNFSPGLNHNPFGGFLCGWFVGYNLYLHQACRIFIFFLYGWRWETCRYCRLIAPFWAFVLKMIEDVCHHPDLQLQRWWCLCHIFYQPVWFNCVTEQFSPSPTPNARCFTSIYPFSGEWSPLPLKMTGSSWIFYWTTRAGNLKEAPKPFVLIAFHGTLPLEKALPRMPNIPEAIVTSGRWKSSIPKIKAWEKWR